MCAANGLQICEEKILIKNFNVINNTFKEISSSARDYAENGVSVAASALDETYNTVATMMIGSTEDIMLLMAGMLRHLAATNAAEQDLSFEKVSAEMEKDFISVYHRLSVEYEEGRLCLRGAEEDGE